MTDHYVIDNFVDKETCNHLINFFNSKISKDIKTPDQSKSDEWETEWGMTDENINETNVNVDPKDYKTRSIVESIFYRGIITTCKRFDTSYLYPLYSSIGKTSTGWGMDDHVDNYDVDTFKGDGKNMFTTVLYLNDNFEGGETVVDSSKVIDQKSGYAHKSKEVSEEDNKVTIAPKAGRLFTFPSDIVHSVKKVTQGERYALLFWSGICQKRMWLLGFNYGDPAEEYRVYDRSINR